MEIGMNSKQLHRHVLPIVILSAGLLLVSLMGINRLLIVGSHSGNSLSQLLSERLLNIQPAKNGLFRISHYQTNSQTDSQLLVGHNTPTGIGVMSDSGEVTVLNTTIDSISQQGLPAHH
jgi:hypothetical protein